MVTASVGFQCPECANAGAKGQRLVDVHRRRTRPVVTITLIAINVAVFVLASVSQARLSPTGVSGDVNSDYGLFSACVGNGEWWRLVTSGFLHAGVLHLAMNMWALYVLGSVLEVELGKARYLLVYFVSLLGGALGVVMVDRMGSPGLTVGASGAIFGLLGALVVLQLSRGVNPLASGLAGVIGINLVITFAIPGISIGGHIGGLLVGGLVGAMLLLGGKPLHQQPDGEQIGRSVAVGAVGASCLFVALVVAQSIFAPQALFLCPA